MKIAIGSDHRGFLHKEFIQQHISFVTWEDVGTYSQERTDYPLFTHKVVDLLLMSQVDCAVLICASGGGMAIAANRHKGIYAVVAWNNTTARQSKEEDNSNILVLPSDFISYEDAAIMIEQWILCTFKGGRYAERIAMIDE